MKFLRFQTPDREIHTGWINEDRVGLIEGDLFGEYMRRDTAFDLKNVKILEPVVPSKILCMAAMESE